ncbi:MAG: hypothetical protein ACRER5_16305 [Pseudomonas sp.]
MKDPQHQVADLRLAALAIAHEAHKVQRDLAGQPYIEHIQRVAAAVADDPIAEVVAILHDVFEDASHLRSAVQAQFPASVVHSIQLLTRDPSVAIEAYYAAIRTDPVALRVKLADIADNSCPARLACLPDATAARLRVKYAKAIRLLGGPGFDA